MDNVDAQSLITLACFAGIAIIIGIVVFVKEVRLFFKEKNSR